MLKQYPELATKRYSFGRCRGRPLSIFILWGAKESLWDATAQLYICHKKAFQETVQEIPKLMEKNRTPISHHAFLYLLQQCPRPCPKHPMDPTALIQTFFLQWSNDTRCVTPKILQVILNLPKPVPPLPFSLLFRDADRNSLDSLERVAANNPLSSPSLELKRRRYDSFIYGPQHTRILKHLLPQVTTLEICAATWSRKAAPAAVRASPG